MRDSGWAMALLPVMLAFAGIAAASDEAADFRREVRRVHIGLADLGCGEYIAPAVALAEHPLFGDRVFAFRRQAFLERLERCATALHRLEDVFRAAEVRSRLAPRQRWPQLIRLNYGQLFGHPESTLAAFEYFTTKERAFLQRLPIYNAELLMRAADFVDDSGERKLRVLETLSRTGISSTWSFHDDFVRFSYARLLLAHGRTEEARAALEGVNDLTVIVRMRVDALFAPLRSDPAFAARLELGNAIERRLAQTRADADEVPGLMLFAVRHSRALAHAGRLEAALATVDDALALHEQRPAAYYDGAYRKGMLLMHRGWLLIELDRRDEAVATLLHAANTPIGGVQNVDAMLLLARYLVALGRASQALSLLAEIRWPTRVEQAWREATRVCAGAQLGLAPEQAAGLAWLEENAREAPSARSMALLCAGDVEAAAAWLIRRLASQSMSSNALLALQRSAPRPSDKLPFERPLLERFDSLREREDVRAAIVRTGRIEDLPVDLGRDY